MEPLAKLISALSLSLIITAYLIIEIKNLRYATYVYILQSLLMCSLLVIFGGQNPGLYNWAITVFITKVIIIPFLLLRTIRRTAALEVPPAIGYLGSIIFITLVVVILYRITHRYVDFIAPTPLATQEPFRTNLAVSLALFIMGLYCILIRRDAIKTVLGLVIMQNGVHLSLVTLVPLLEETGVIGIVTDVVIAVYLLLYVIQGVYQKFGSTDTFNLKVLRW
jgi:hydrogenase-4 component E